jgi:hypothetical protein
MSAGWVAATVRGRCLVRGGLGIGGARELAGLPSWEHARARLTDVVPHRLPEDADRATARRAALATTVWQLRVLAGWLPPSGAPLARLAAGPAEIVALEDHRARLEGTGPAASWTAARPPAPSIALGSLGIAWPRAAATSTPTALRALLARSVWGDPGGTSEAELALALRLSFAARVRHQGGALARSWASGAAAVLVAREQLAFRRPLNPTTARQADRLLGIGWRDPRSVPELAARLPSDARWVLAEVEQDDQLWRSEVAWARRVAGDARPVVAAGRPDRDTVVALLALMLLDLWLTEVAIESAARGAAGREVLDAFAA